MAKITIFQTESLKEIPRIKADIDKIKKTHKIKIKKEQESAVIGELAGNAINILMSNELQVPLTILGLIELGKGGLKLIKKIHTSGKVCDIDKEFASALVFTKALKKYKKEYPNEVKNFNPDKIKTIGIMEVDYASKILNNICLKNFDDEGRSLMYFMGVIIKRPRKRSLTFWYIIRTDGKTCASWETQTFTNTLPKEYR